MNQNAPIEAATPERPAPRARPAAPVPPAALSPEGRALIRALTEGDQALARRKDLGELLRRLQAAPAAEAAPAQDQLDQFDRLEGALNRIDGALRIELAPILKAAVEEGLAARAPRPPRRRGKVFLFLAGLAAGVFAGPALTEVGLRAWQDARPMFATILPPNWGIPNSENQVE